MEDILLIMAKNQGYVPKECKLNGQIVMGLINQGQNPCKGCNIDCGKNKNSELKDNLLK